MDTVPIPARAQMNPEARGSAELPAADSLAAQEKVKSDVPQLAIHMPVDARGVALGILATLALVFALQWAQSFAISLLVGIFLAYALNPLVVWLERIKLPRIVGASIVMLSVVSALGVGTYSLRGQMQTIVDQLPEAASKLSARLASLRIGELINMQKVQTAARALEKATGQVPPKPKVASADRIRNSQACVIEMPIRYPYPLLCREFRARFWSRSSLPSQYFDDKT